MPKNLPRGQSTTFERQPQFPINHFIIKTHPGCILARSREPNSIHSRPIDGPQTHRARLTAGINLAPGQLMAAQLSAGIADGEDLCMRRWIPPRDNLVPTSTDYFVVADYDGAKWPARSGSHFLNRQADRFPHVCLLHHALFLKLASLRQAPSSLRSSHRPARGTLAAGTGDA